MTVTSIPQALAPIDSIDIDTANVRPLDQDHVDALAGSIALRGLIVPITLRPSAERFTLITGHHRLAACRRLGMSKIPYTLREQDQTSADTAAENILRKELSPLAEARAVAYMFSEGYTPDGAASALGWSRARVTARAKILELPPAAQQLLDTGVLPVSSVDLLERIAGVSRGLCDAALSALVSKAIRADDLLRNPSWVLGRVSSSSGKAFAASLSVVRADQIAELRLGKKATAAYEEASKIHRELERYIYSSLSVHFGEVEVDQARAAQVLLEFEEAEPLIVDRALYRELVKQAIARTRDELLAAKASADAERAKQRRQGKRAPSARQELDAKHRASVREFARRAHTSNLELGASLLKGLAKVDPGNLDVARFFAYGLLGATGISELGTRDERALILAANGIRLVFDEHRNTVTPRLKRGGFGKTKVTYAEPEDALKAMWKFVEGGRSSSELFGRVLVVFAAQHYAEQLVLARSKRRGSALPRSHKGTAEKAFERLAKDALPAAHKSLQRAIAAEARSYYDAALELTRRVSSTTSPDAG